MRLAIATSGLLIVAALGENLISRSSFLTHMVWDMASGNPEQWPMYETDLIDSGANGQRLENSSSDLGIGCSHDTNPTNFFNGQLSDLYVWNRALNDEEVTALNGPLSFDNFVNLSAPACSSLSLVNSLVL